MEEKIEFFLILIDLIPSNSEKWQDLKIFANFFRYNLFHISCLQKINYKQRNADADSNLAVFRAWRL